MKILHVTTQKPFSTGSGVYLSGILKELGKDHEQFLICGLNADEDDAFLQEDHAFILEPVLFQTEELPFAVPGMSDVMPYTSKRYDSLTAMEAETLKAAFLMRIQKALHEFKPDAVICQHLYLITSLVCETVKADMTIPVAGICHGSDLRQFRSTDKWREEIQDGVKKLDVIISSHEEQAKNIRELFGLPDERIKVLGSGFDSDIFQPDLEVSKEEKPLRIVYTGKLSRAKGVPELLEALERVAEEKELHLTLIGGGGDPSEFEEIRKMAEDRSFPVVMTGQIRQEEAASIYHHSHIFVLPSYYEGLPLVVPEALACGLKVAVTALPGYDVWLEPYQERVRLIPVPELKSLDQPTEEGRLQFIKDITGAVSELEKIPDMEAPDMSSHSWKRLSGRILEAMDLST